MAKVTPNETVVRAFTLELSQGEADALYTLLGELIAGEIVNSRPEFSENSLFQTWNALYNTGKVKSLKVESTSLSSNYGNDRLKVNFKK